MADQIEQTFENLATRLSKILGTEIKSSSLVSFTEPNGSEDNPILITDKLFGYSEKHHNYDYSTRPSRLIYGFFVRFYDKKLRIDVKRLSWSDEPKETVTKYGE